MSAAAKKSKSTPIQKRIKCCECLNEEKSKPMYTICSKLLSNDHISYNLASLTYSVSFMQSFLNSVIATENAWEPIFDWTDIGSSQLLVIIHKLLRKEILDQKNINFLEIMKKAILTDQWHDFLSKEERTQFNSKKCTDLKDNIDGLRKCLITPVPAIRLTKNDTLATGYVTKENLTTPQTTDVKLSVKYMITDMTPSCLKINDVVDIYTITSYIDSAPCSKDVLDSEKCTEYKIPNSYEFIITNLALAFYQSFFNQLNEFTFHIECKNNCNTEHSKIFNTKNFTIIITHIKTQNTHRFEGIGGEKGTFTVPRIIRTLAICDKLCPDTLILIDWLSKSCKIKDDEKIKQIVINFHTLMKGFGDFCQMFICLFFYYVRINLVDASGNQSICVFNKNIILATNDSYLAYLALLSNCPHIIGHSTQAEFRWIYIDSNITYLGKTIYECWNDFNIIQLIKNKEDNGLTRKNRQLFNIIKFHDSHFCNINEKKIESKDTFLNNFEKSIISYHTQIIIFEKEFAILQEGDIKNTFTLYLSQEDIRLNTLDTIKEIYQSNPLHSCASTKKITFVMRRSYDIKKTYTPEHIARRRELSSQLHDFVDALLTAHATCKFYQQVFTTKMINIVYKGKGLTLLNASSIPSATVSADIKGKINTVTDIITDKLQLIKKNITFPNSNKYPIDDIDFDKFKTKLVEINNGSKVLDAKEFLDTGILDPLIAFAKIKTYNDKSNMEDRINSAYHEHLPKSQFAGSTVQLLINIHMFLDVTSSMITVYRELLSKMEKQDFQINNINLQFDIKDDTETIIETTKTDLQQYIADIKIKIKVLNEQYLSFKTDNHVKKIIDAQKQFDKIMNFLNDTDDPNHETIHEILKGYIKDYLKGFVGYDKNIGILGKTTQNVLKELSRYIAIIETGCEGECVKDCEPPGPKQASVDVTADGPSVSGGYKKMLAHTQLTNVKKHSKRYLKGGVKLSELISLNCSVDFLNLCEQYEIYKSHKDLSKKSEFTLLYSSEFFNDILLSNDMFDGMNFKNYSYRLFYNYFTYILVWIFTRYMQSNLDKFKQYVDCYRLLIIEKHMLVGNIVNRYFYYLSQYPETKIFADSLLEHFKIYEGYDLSILDDYKTKLKLLTERTIEFPHKFNEFIRGNLDLRGALGKYDDIEDQHSGQPDYILNDMIPIYTELFDINFPTNNQFVMEYVISYRPSLNLYDMPVDIVNTIEPIKELKHSEIGNIESEIGDLKNEISDVEKEIGKLSSKKRKRKDSDPAKKTKSSKDLDKLKILKATKSSKTNDLENLINKLDVLKKEHDDLEKLYTLCSNLPSIIETYNLLNTRIQRDYLYPDEIPRIEELQSINTLILTPVIVTSICQRFNDLNIDLTKKNKKSALLNVISKIDTQISTLKNEKRALTSTNRTRRGKAKKTALDKRRETRITQGIRGQKGPQATRVKALKPQTVDDIQEKLRKLKELKSLKMGELNEFVKIAGGVLTIDTTPKLHVKQKIINKTVLSKYNLRVEQYKNKGFTSYFEKKIREYINDPTVDIYTIGVRKMKDILKNIYNITK